MLLAKATKLFRHLMNLNSVDPRALLKRLITFIPDFYWRKGTSQALVSITLELTYRCNLKCEFCFERDTVLNKKMDELSLDEIRNLAKQARRHWASFYVTGGEPFVRKDCTEVLETILAAGCRAGVNTNGMLLTPERADRLVKAGMNFAIVSINGPHDVHDAVVGIKGALQRTLDNLRYLAEHKGKTRVFVNAVITDGTVERIHEVPELLKGIPIDGITFQHESFLTREEMREHDQVWSRRFPGDKTELVVNVKDGAMPDPARIFEQTERLKTEAVKHGMHIVMKPELSYEELDTWYSEHFRIESKCVYPWTETRVMPNGDVALCPFIPMKMGNIRHAPLDELLNNDRYRSLRNAIRDEGGLFPGCARCCKLYRNVASRVMTKAESAAERYIPLPVLTTSGAPAERR